LSLRSHRHIFFERQKVSAHPELANIEPRVLHPVQRFYGMTRDCTAAGVARGCLKSLTNFGVVATVTEPGGTSLVVTDNFSKAGQASGHLFH
jgi:hypothetical protein